MKRFFLRKIYPLILLGFFLPIFGMEAVVAEDLEPSLTASLEPSRITIGDPVKLTLQVDLPEGAQIVSADFKETLGDLEVKKLGKEIPLRMKDGRMRHTVWATVTAYATGTHVVPPLTVTVRLAGGKETVLETLRHFVVVGTVVPEGDPMEDIRDIKGVITLGGFLLWPWLFIGALLLAISVLWKIFSRRQALRPKPATPPSPPHELALEALEKIDAMGLAERDVKEYYFLVSGVLRRYLEDRFGLRAPEQTTEEFMEKASQDHHLTGEQKSLLQRFLEECDLVKFAKHRPPTQDVFKISRTAREFIHETKPAPF